AVEVQAGIAPHGPDIVGGIGRDVIDWTDTGEGGAGDDGPARAIPVLDQDPLFGDVDVTRGPDVGRRDGRHRTQQSPVLELRAGDDAPAHAVPVLDQRIDGTASSLIPDGPDVVAGRGGDVVEDAAMDNRGRDDAPARPVEVRGERLLGGDRTADGPDIIVRDRRRRGAGRIVEL